MYVDNYPARRIESQRADADAQHQKSAWYRGRRGDRHPQPGRDLYVPALHGFCGIGEQLAAVPNRQTTIQVVIPTGDLLLSRPPLGMSVR